MGVGVLGGAAFLLPVQPLFADAVRDRLPESRLPAPVPAPVTIPPVVAPVRSDATTDYYEITMRQAPAPIVPGLPPTQVFGYNGTTPGPAISVRRGATTGGRAPARDAHGPAGLCITDEGLSRPLPTGRYDVPPASRTRSSTRTASCCSPTTARRR